MRDLSYARHSLATEASVLTLLGREHRWDGETLSTPHMGETLDMSSLTAEDVSQMMAVILNAPPVPESLLDDYAETVIDRCHFRLKSRGVTGQVLELAERWLPETSFPSGDRLVHVDPHTGNWVRSDDGSLHLIDWESAMRGSPLAGAGAFCCVLAQFRPELAHHAMSLVAEEDRKHLLFPARVVAASVIGWAFWAFGEECALQVHGEFVRAHESVFDFSFDQDA